MQIASGNILPLTTLNKKLDEKYYQENRIDKESKEISERYMKKYGRKK